MPHTYATKTEDAHTKLVEITVCLNPLGHWGMGCYYASILEAKRMPPSRAAKRGNYTDWQYERTSLMEGGTINDMAKEVEQFMLRQYQEHGPKAVKLRVRWRLV